MLSTRNALFVRKTSNDEAEAGSSNLETAAQMEDVNLSTPPCSTREEPVMERIHHGGGWLLSGIICINILILGSAIVGTSAFSSEAVTVVHRQIFLIFLLVLTMIWMVFYMVFTSQKCQGSVLKDGHAGSVWLKVGLVLFGVLSLLMDIFKIANYVGYLHCDSAVKVALPVVQSVFLFVQTYFLWTHSKDCVQKYTNFTRCGLTLIISTNLVVWMVAVTEESLHQTGNPNSNISVSKYRANYGEKKCKCSHSACSTFEGAFYYLYPFNIEYSLFAAAMSYVMWRNVGRLVENHSHPKLKFRLKDLCLGPVLGLLLVIGGLVGFIFYEVYIQQGGEDQRNLALLIHFSTNVIIVSLLSVSTVIGCVLYRLDHRGHVSEKNPSRSLDVRLLVGSSLGQFIISYFTIVAMVATEVRGSLSALNLSWAVLLVLQLGLQNYFIIEGLNRKPFHLIQMAAVHTNPPTVIDHGGTAGMNRKKSRRVRFLVSDELSWKRRTLKEVCAFLLLGNIILWIMPAFGARPQFDFFVMLNFYSYSVWTAIVNIGLPFGIFYRMHSVASLLEVYLIT